jgi:hypothetical protein
LIERGHRQGKWKDYTVGNRRKCSKSGKTVSQKRGAIEGGEEGNQRRHELRKLLKRTGITGSHRVG